MKNFSIAKKLLTTFGLIIALFLITVIFALQGLRQTGGNFENFYQVGYPVSLRTAEIRAATQTGMQAVTQTMLTSDMRQTQELVSQAKEQFAQVDEGFLFLQKNFQGEQAVITEARSILDEAAPYRDQILDLVSSNQDQEASVLMVDSFQPLMKQFRNVMLEIDSSTSQMADEEYQASEKSQSSTVILLITISVVALLATIVLACYIIRGLTRPIKEIETAAKEMEQGKLQVTIGYRSRDELGSLAESMRTMADHIRFYMNEITSCMQQLAGGDLDVKKREAFLGDFIPVQRAIRTLIDSLSDALGQINLSADQVASGSDQVSSGAQALSQGAAEQASSVEELAATINEISQQVKNNADNAQEASGIADQVGGEMTVSNRQMQQMIEAMDDISRSSNEIGKIIKTIEDIAFQTNILALNAAVEAARAGTAGKGFAVVADEVRSLASKSAEASNNTAALIEDSIRAVESGAKIARDTAESLMKAVDGAQQVTAVVDKISLSSGEQARAITQVTQGVEQISSVVQTNSATAEESAAASEELSGQAQVLKDLVGRFRLKDAPAEGAAVAAPPSHLQTDYWREDPADASKY